MFTGNNILGLHDNMCYYSTSRTWLHENMMKDIHFNQNGTFTSKPECSFSLTALIITFTTCVSVLLYLIRVTVFII